MTCTSAEALHETCAHHQRWDCQVKTTALSQVLRSSSSAPLPRVSARQQCVGAQRQVPARIFRWRAPHAAPACTVLLSQRYVYSATACRRVGDSVGMDRYEHASVCIVCVCVSVCVSVCDPLRCTTSASPHLPPKPEHGTSSYTRKKRRPDECVWMHIKKESKRLTRAHPSHTQTHTCTREGGGRGPTPVRVPEVLHPPREETGDQHVRHTTPIQPAPDTLPHTAHPQLPSDKAGLHRLPFDSARLRFPQLAFHMHLSTPRG